MFNAKPIKYKEEQPISVNILKSKEINSQNYMRRSALLLQIRTKSI